MNSRKVLVIGSGAREHVIVEKLWKTCWVYYYGETVNPEMSRLVEDYYIIDPDYSFDKILEYIKQNEIPLVVIGPESLLERGLTDFLLEHNISCIGPTKRSAMIETSKGYLRNLLRVIDGMDKFNPKWNAFMSETDNVEYFMAQNPEYVIKKDGLAEGKGVFVKGDHFNTYNEAIGLMRQVKPFLLEEKLIGNEFSLMSFADGETCIHMPPIQDFKRKYDDDKGPNTGSMGCISPPSFYLSQNDINTCQELNEIIANITKFTGIIYGSFIKTKTGEIKVIEYNARFGDPEAIIALNLLTINLYDIFTLIVNKQLNKIKHDHLFNTQYGAVCKYITVENIGDSIDISNWSSKHKIYYGKCEKHEDSVVAIRSKRVIALYVQDNTVNNASLQINTEFSKISGGHWRRDIGLDHKYKVNINETNKLVKDINSVVSSTFTDNVIGEFGDFAGMMKTPKEGGILVSSTDGVGTKSLLAINVLGTKGYNSLGHDLVNHCINDILVKGAYPYFFLDYFAANKINKDETFEFISGVAEACKNHGCVLIGGETAEMPDVYNKSAIDVVGMIVGIIPSPIDMIDGKRDIKEGNLVLAWPSSGPHTNGYTLLRKIINDHNTPIELQKQMVQPHRCYLDDYKKLKEYNIKVNGLCHITGGGLYDNPIRVIPDNTDMYLYKDFWKIPPLFTYIQEKGDLSDSEMFKTFNCGLGMLLIVDNDPITISDIYELIPNTMLVGSIVDGTGKVFVK